MFFKGLCVTKLCSASIKNAEASIIETVYKLKNIFLLTFIDVMEHLVVHLPFEAKVGGPMQHRWIYPFEKCMLYLKRKVKNKARTEGSICEAYILEEISNFSSFIFQSTSSNKMNQVP